MTLKEQLDSNIPQDAVESREAWRGGPKLSYLSGAYVIKRMNDVIGQGNWGYAIIRLERVFEGQIEQSSGSVYTTSYIAQVRLWANLAGSMTDFIEVGYGDGTDKKSQGKAHELATKEAVTDAVKRAAKNLGISLGLGLYFKSGEFVEDVAPRKVEDEAPKKDEKKAPKTSTKILRDQIKNSFAVLQAQKKITKEVFVKDYLKGAKTDDLDDTAVASVLAMIKTNFPELGL